jgi:hypothetical protein
MVMMHNAAHCFFKQFSLCVWHVRRDQLRQLGGSSGWEPGQGKKMQWKSQGYAYACLLPLNIRLRVKRQGKPGFKRRRRVGSSRCWTQSLRC